MLSSKLAQSLVWETIPCFTAYAANCVSFAKSPIASPPSYEPLIKEFKPPIASLSDLSQKAEASAANSSPSLANVVAVSISKPKPLNFAVSEVM